MKKVIGFVAAMFVLTGSVAHAEWVIGFNGDDSRGYGYLSRYRRINLAPDRQLVLSATASYLYYEVQGFNGTTRVTSPGLGAAAVYRWIYPRIEFGVGPGYEARWTRRRGVSPDLDDEIDHGVVGLADLHFRPNDVTQMSLAASYSDASEWSYGYGGLVQVPYGDRTALQLHGGQSRIRHRSGVEETRPYFSVSVLRSF